MSCVACGWDIPAGSRFCPHCGRAVSEAAATAPEGPPPAPPGPPPAPPEPPFEPPPSSWAPPPPGTTAAPGTTAPPGTFPPPGTTPSPRTAQPPPTGPAGYPPPAPGTSPTGHPLPPPPPPPPSYGPPPTYTQPPAYGPPPGGYGTPPPGAYGAPGPAGYPGGTSGPVEYGLASFGQRVGATVIDTFVIIAAFILAFVIVGMTAHSSSSFDDSGGDPSGLGALVLFLTWFGSMAYPIVFEGRPDGQTIGKKAMGIRVVRRANGAPLGYPLASGRFLARALEGMFTFGIGLLWPLWDPLKQTLHDKAAGTLVVRSSVYPPPGVR